MPHKLFPPMLNEHHDNLISFVAHNCARVDVHRHHCVQIVAGINGSFSGTIAGEAYPRKTGFIINQNVAHSCQAADASVIVFFIDADSYCGWQLTTLLAGRPFLDIEAFLTEAQARRICAEGNQHLPGPELGKLADEILASVLLANPSAAEMPVDGRVGKAVEFINAHLGENIRLEDLAGRMSLSPERARHLFAQTTGAPFSQYILWKRVKRVIVTVLQEKSSLTEASINAGFTDQAHFCHIFKRTFGMPAKALLKNSRYIQFLTPSVE
ncbi:MAG TPA: AraC family transcriptional regulator [Blastocatellia bacterium]|nr:AraC family transcriptional regulator [Blastocatellia bacterium]HMZ22566.1 AraC family transcriptional regulator [Blastocatellia bacterium]HNG28517.1 AraC family transcriptional regulator [Blastocatellia bacterium]